MSGPRGIAGASLMCATLLADAAPLEHAGICNASAAVAIGANRFLVADDEDNILRLYDSERSGAELERYDLSSMLQLAGQKEKWEVDIEGAAQIGQRVYWIGSHGTNADGEARLKRQQIFATDLGDAQGKLTVTWAGRYTGLLEAMNAVPGIGRNTLLDASRRVPEKDNGLSIEALAASPQGHLLIGFRGPLVDGKALIMTLENPATLTSRTPTPRFAAPITLQLGGKGIRSMEYAPALKSYLIVAGPNGGAGDFQLYAWSGQASSPPEALAFDLPPGVRPEAMFARADGVRYTFLSDDGDEFCKDKKTPAARKKFRSYTISISIKP